MSKTIMLIHGAWLNAHSWEGFKARYELGATPSSPRPGRSTTALRPSYVRPRTPLSLRSASMSSSITTMAVTQHLLDRGPGVAGVVIDPAPTSGVLVGWQTIKSTFPVFFSWGSWRRVMTMSRRFFSTRFAQTVPPAQVDATYDRYIVPTAGKIYWDGLVSAAGKIRWDNPDRAPLLLIGGGIDLIAQAKMTKAMFEKQKQARSNTELKIYPNRSHWTCIQEGWEEVADFALDWAAKNARAPNVLPLKAA
jgi:pimeloyl-ACP methyl ester carboxylesterase